METLVLICLIAAVIGTVASLAVGLGGFTGGGAFNRKYGNMLMRMRVAFQFASVLLFLLYMYLLKGGVSGG